MIVQTLPSREVQPLPASYSPRVEVDFWACDCGYCARPGRRVRVVLIGLFVTLATVAICLWWSP